MTPTSEALFQVRDLHVRPTTEPGAPVADEILRGLDLTVRDGEVHAIMGPNGSGKSTLGATLLGSPEYEVTNGSITFRGDDVTDWPTDERAKAGMFLAFQYPQEIAGVSVIQFLRQALSARKGIDLSVLEAVAQQTDWSFSNGSMTDARGIVQDQIRIGSGPTYKIYPCKGGFVRLVILSPRQWHAMRAWLGEPDYLQDPKYDGFLGRMEIADPSDMTPKEVQGVCEFLIGYKKKGQFRTFWDGFQNGVDLLASKEVIMSSCWEPVQLVARKKGMPLDEASLIHLLKKKYPTIDNIYANYQPIFLIDQMRAVCEFEGIPYQMTPELIDRAWANMFVKEEKIVH